MEQNKEEQQLNGKGSTPFAQTYFHGTKADLKIGDFIKVGNNSNFGLRKNANYIFLTATLDAAIWGAELALGEEPGRIYIVEPTGPIEDDPQFDRQEVSWKPDKVIPFPGSASGCW